jgi:hypothetical protein
MYQSRGFHMLAFKHVYYKSWRKKNITWKGIGWKIEYKDFYQKIKMKILHARTHT